MAAPNRAEWLLIVFSATLCPTCATSWNRKAKLYAYMKKHFASCLRWLGSRLILWSYSAHFLDVNEWLALLHHHHWDETSIVNHWQVKRRNISVPLQTRHPLRKGFLKSIWKTLSPFKPNPRPDHGNEYSGHCLYKIGCDAGRNFESFRCIASYHVSRAFSSRDMSSTASSPSDMHGLTPSHSCCAGIGCFPVTLRGSFSETTVGHVQTQSTLQIV